MFLLVFDLGCRFVQTPRPGGGGYSHIQENYLRMIIGSTSELQPTNYEKCAYNKAQVYIELHVINEARSHHKGQ